MKRLILFIGLFCLTSCLENEESFDLQYSDYNNLIFYEKELRDSIKSDSLLNSDSQEEEEEEEEDNGDDDPVPGDIRDGTKKEICTNCIIVRH